MSERRAVIEVENLHVRYGDVHAVRGLSLCIERGSLFGFLGPNGAGKTSTLRCIVGLKMPSSGRVRVLGWDPQQDPKPVHRATGVVPQRLAVYESLTVGENLKIFGALHGVPQAELDTRVEWGLELARLQSSRGARVETLSSGMVRRLNLACALLHDPEIIICDEPSTGVDAQSRNHIFAILRALNDEGITVVYTTHVMREVETLCDEVAIIDDGGLVARDRLENLVSARDESGAREVAMRLPGDVDIDELVARLAEIGIAVDDVRPARRDLEEVFLDLTGHELRDDELTHDAD